MRARDRVVGAAHDRARHAVDEPFERGDELLESAVIVEVVGFDARHDRGLGAEPQERAVALVGFDHEPLASAVRGVGADLVDLAADHEAGLPARAPQDEREHRRGRRLAVGTRDRDRARRRRERGQRRRPMQHGDARRSRAAASSTFRSRDRGRVHDRVGVGGNVLGAVPDAHARRPPQAGEHDRLLDVGAAHLVAHACEQQCDRAHADAADADDVHGAAR